MRNPQPLHLPLMVDRSASRPLNLQLVDQIRAAITSGVLAAGDRVPSTRTLARALRVSRSVPIAAYLELFSSGELDSRQGSGTYVSGQAAEPGEYPHFSRVPVPASTPVTDLSPQDFRADCFPTVAWRCAWHRAGYRPPPTTSPPPLGILELRQAVALYLARTRGLSCDPQQVVITSGIRHTIELAARLLSKDKASIALEDPGYPSLHRSLRALGHDVISIPVDEHGVQIQHLPDHAGITVITPDNQFPLGGTLSMSRRRALLDWSPQNDRYILELDNGSELRANGGFMPSLYSMDTHRRVIHAGSFTHLFSMELPLGYAILPASMIGAAEELISSMQEEPSAIAQRAAADLLSWNVLSRYIGRFRRSLETKRAIVKRLLDQPHAPWQLHGLAGLHASIRLPRRLDADRIHHKLAALGIHIPTVTSYSARSLATHNSLILGYGHVEDEQLSDALQLVVRALQADLLSQAA